MKTSLNSLYSFTYFWIIVLAFTILNGCKEGSSKTNSAVKSYVHIEGKTMGTLYHISYFDKAGRNLKPSIDSLLISLNQEVSTYIPESLISQLNSSRVGICLEANKKNENWKSYHFRKIFKASQETYELTQGTFDPTIMPLVNYWGFGYKGHQAVEKANKDSIQNILQAMGMSQFELDAKPKDDHCAWFIHKHSAAAELDFSAIAKGYGVDIVAQLLAQKGIEDYKVEIGGELVCRGKNPKAQTWKIGINTPDPKAKLNEFKAIIAIDNKAMASSGNYRNFHEINGVKYGHEINPKTGYPVDTDLLSVSVMADDCMTADAYATAFMIMGLDASLKKVNSTPQLEAYFISSDASGEFVSTATDGFEAMLMQTE